MFGECLSLYCGVLGDKMENKVSIIIPAYNAELYLEQCVESILNQTYRNIEVIIINDGSIDKTGEIADRLKIIDERIIVIHNQNKGVSASRNDGLQKSTGDYIVFVDADDFLSDDYVDYMMKLVEATGSVFCLSQNCYTKVNEEQINGDKIETLAPANAIALLLSPRVIVGCWNKIFKKDFLLKQDLVFSTSLFYGEGLTFIVEAAQAAGSVGVGNRKVYYYRRNNEASATTKFNIEKMRNGEIALKNLKDNITLKADVIDTMWLLHMCTFYLGAIVRIKALKLTQAYHTEYKEWSKFLKKNTPSLILKKNISLYRKCMLIAGCVSPGLLAKMDQKRRQNIAQNSV